MENRLDKKVTHYSYLAATVGFTAVAQQADASIVYTVVRGASGVTDSYFSIDIDGQSVSSVYGGVEGSDIYLSGSTMGSFGSSQFARNGFYPQKFAYGDTIDSNLVFADRAHTWNYGSPDNSPTYAGITLVTGRLTQYGWLHFNWDNVTAKATLYAFAYETDPNTSIAAGAIPEPKHAALLMSAGAAGLIALRKRRRKALAPS